MGRTGIFFLAIAIGFIGGFAVVMTTDQGAPGIAIYAGR